MGGALSSKANQPVQLILLGLDYAGKSSVLARLAGEEMRCLQPTRGFTIKTLSVGGSGLVKVWDLGGGRDVRGYWPAYYEKAQGVVFVIDSSDSRRLHEVSSMLQCVLDEPSLSSTPLLLLANKQDLPQALHTSEVSSSRFASL